jgi:hypothetical protein
MLTLPDVRSEFLPDLKSQTLIPLIGPAVFLGYRKAYAMETERLESLETVPDEIIPQSSPLIR